MATHNWGTDRLKRNRLDQHILLVVEDWNEPDSFGTDASTVVSEGAAIIVITPLSMRWSGGPDHPDSDTHCIVVGTYMGDELKDTAIVSRTTGEIEYHGKGATV